MRSKDVNSSPALKMVINEMEHAVTGDLQHFETVLAGENKVDRTQCNETNTDQKLSTIAHLNVCLLPKALAVASVLGEQT